MTYEPVVTMTVIDFLLFACLILLAIEVYKNGRDIMSTRSGLGLGVVLIGIGIIVFSNIIELANVYRNSPVVVQFGLTGLLSDVHLRLSGHSISAGLAGIALGLAFLLRIRVDTISKRISSPDSEANTGFRYPKESGLVSGRGAENDNAIQAALARSEERFTQLVNLLPQTVFEVSIEGKVLYTNPAGFEMFQFTEAEVEAGLNIGDYFDSSDRKRGLENFNKILHGQSIGPNEYAMVRKDGQPMSAIISSRPIFSGEKVIGVLGAIFDISDRKKTERELQASQAMLRNVLDTIPVRVFWKDKESNFLGCNVQFAKDAGFNAPAEIIGKNDSEIVDEDKAERY